MKYPYRVLDGDKIIAKFRSAVMAEMFALKYSERYATRVVEVRFYGYTSFRRTHTYIGAKLQ